MGSPLYLVLPVSYDLLLALANSHDGAHDGARVRARVARLGAVAYEVAMLAAAIAAGMCVVGRLLLAVRVYVRLKVSRGAIREMGDVTGDDVPEGEVCR